MNSEADKDSTRGSQGGSEQSEVPPHSTDDTDLTLPRGLHQSFTAENQPALTGAMSFEALSKEEQSEALQLLWSMESMQKVMTASQKSSLSLYTERFGPAVPSNLQSVLDNAARFAEMAMDSVERTPPSLTTKHALEAELPKGVSKRRKVFNVREWRVTARCRPHLMTITRLSESTTGKKGYYNRFIITYTKHGDEKHCTLNLSPAREHKDSGPHNLRDFLRPMMGKEESILIWTKQNRSKEGKRFPTVQQESDAEALTLMAENSASVNKAWEKFAEDRKRFWQDCKEYDVKQGIEGKGKETGEGGVDDGDNDEESAEEGDETDDEEDGAEGSEA